MPTLDTAQLKALQTRPVRTCPLCHRALHPNYCRTCDVYFEAGHMTPACCPDGIIHDSHRTY